MKFTLAIITLLCICTAPARSQQPAIGPTPDITPAPASKGYAPVNGLNMYYEVYGEGQPLVLIHGSFMNINLNWNQMIPQLAASHKVIALELQGHGRTADTDRPYSFAGLADDVAGLLKYLKIDSADILGYSLGATIGLQLAISHPAVVKKLVFISSVYKFGGWIKPAREAFPALRPEYLEQTPLKADYDHLAPDTAHWTTFVEKMIKFAATPFDLGADKVRSLHIPVLIIKGDNDGIELSHTAEMYALCGGGVFGDMTGLPPSRLAIIPGTTHVSLMMETKQLLAVISPFLK